MQKITMDDKRIFTSITSACRNIFNCEPEMRTIFNGEKRPHSCFVPSALSGKYGEPLLWFANADTEHKYWIDTLEKDGNEIREESVIKPSPVPFHANDEKKRIVFWNFGKTGETKQYKFVGVFENDESRMERDVNYFNKISDTFPLEADNILPKTTLIIIERNLPIFLNEKQFTQAGITIDDAAKTLGTNRGSLSKYINSVRNKSFSQWINELRIEYSKTLMRENPLLSLDEIAADSGFFDRSHFAKHFTQNTGIAPSVWRKNL